MMSRSHVLVNTSAMAASLTALCASMQLSLTKTVSQMQVTCLSWFLPARFSAADEHGITAETALWLIAAYACFWLGSQLPDIDSKTSTLGRHFHLPVGHRTWTHSIWAVSLMGIPAFFHPFGRWALLGYVLHLMGDAVSAAGICFFYPFQKFKKYSGGAFVAPNHRLKLYRAGRMSEGVFVVLFVAFMCGVNFYLGHYKAQGWLALYQWLTM